MKTRLRSKFMAVAIMFALLLQAFMPTATVFAEEINPSTVKIISIKNDAGNPLTGTVNMNQTFRIDATFELPDGKVKKDDTTTVTLPDEIIFDSSVTTFDLKDKTDNVVATAKREGNKLVVTYNEYVENKSDISGSFYFSVRFNRDKYKAPGKYELVFDVSGTKISAGEIEYEGTKDLPKSAIAKYGQTKPNAKNTLQFFLAVNRYGKELKNAVVVDKLNIPLDAEVFGKIIKESVVIKKGVWEYNEDTKQWKLTGETVVNDKKITVDNNGHTLNIELGNVTETEGYQIIYDVKMDYDLVNGEIIKNNAEVTATNEPGGKAEFSTAYIEAGGEANGYNYTIKIHKESEDGISLANAKFEVIRNSTQAKVGEITTDGVGDGSLGGLLKDNYTLKEIEAPKGYILDETEIPVTPDDFGTDKTVLKTVKNKPVTTSISVEKKWIGPVKDSVTVHLYADDVDTGNSVSLNALNGWKATFDNLRKFKADGTEIKYTIKEDAVENYKSEITGDMTAGFIVKNTNTEKVSVPIMKQWVGKATDKVEVKLLADNKEKETATLTADTGWKHTFKDLPKYDDKDGHEIVYTISEVKIDGYTTGISGTAKDGFIIINTITGKVSIPVTKKWFGRPVDSIMINLYADGKKIDSQKLSKDNNWQYTFKDLDEYKDGKEITYTIDEEKVNGYTTTITGNAKDGYIITNTKDNPKLPKTGDSSNVGIFIGLLLLSVTLLTILGVKRRKEVK